MIARMDSTTAQVTRWKRYGKDRLYIKLADETQLGYWDLMTDEACPESPKHLEAITQAAAHWKSGRVGWVAPVSANVRSAPASLPALSRPEPDVIPAETAAPPMRPWLDLTTNPAGAEARGRATAAREAAPTKSLFARVLGVHTAERSWRIGADGEERVAAQLAKLSKKDPRWHAIHSIPVGSRGSDLDHLVVGPGGVFAINAKHHPKAKVWAGGATFMVNGARYPYLRNSRYEAQRAADLLTAACKFSVHVEAMIVTVNALDVTVKGATGGVHVLSHDRLVDWLLRHGNVFSAATVQVIHDQARRSTTWQP